MATLKQLASGRKDLFMLDPNIIQEEPGWNVRTNNDELTAHIRQLADSIKENGVQMPLTVYMKGDIPTITDGHCRLKAVKLAISEGAEIETVPVRNEERTANDADRTLSMLTRNSGKSLTPMEQSEVVKRLLSFGWLQSKISRRTGYSRSHITNLITLSSAPAQVQKMVKSGEVSATLATQTIKENGSKAVDVLEKAVGTAKKEGKKKATRQHVTKAVNWKVLGPQLLSALEDIMGHAETLSQQGDPNNTTRVKLLKSIIESRDLINKCKL
jgi:ParB/RepB/Spo0J family partition protein